MSSIANRNSQPRSLICLKKRVAYFSIGLPSPNEQLAVRPGLVELVMFSSARWNGTK
jgi:hypothetical protein